MFHANRAPIIHKDQHYLQTERTELPLEPLHLGVPSGVSKMVSQPMVHQAQTVHLSCTKTNTVSKRTKVRFYMTHVIQEFHRVSKLISQHMVRSLQTVHLSCIKISNISKHTKLSFHLRLFTQEYHWVRPKWCLRVWCIRHKPYTYLALKLTHLLGVLSGASKLIFEHMVCYMQAVTLLVLACMLTMSIAST